MSRAFCLQTAASTRRRALGPPSLAVLRPSQAGIAPRPPVPGRSWCSGEQRAWFPPPFRQFPAANDAIPCLRVGPGTRSTGRSGISRACVCWRGDPVVDDLPDLLVQLVLLPDAVRGPEQHRRDRDQPDRPADRRIDPLVAPQADAQLTLPG